MKFNWGTKIGIVYTAFVVFILGMVYMAFGEKFDLVTEDYYAQEIAFQEKIDSKNRHAALDNQLKIKVEEGNLVLYFPHEVGVKINGKINCFRPSDESKDFVEEVKSSSTKYSIPLKRFVKGKYTIKVDWKVDEKHFYDEQIIIIP